MSFDKNFVNLVGGITREPELRVTGGGTAVLNIGIAVNQGKKQADGTWEDEAHFFNVVAFGQTAENASETLAKGNRINVTGRLAYRTWEKDGEKRNAVEIIADSIAVDLSRATAEITKAVRTDG